MNYYKYWLLAVAIILASLNSSDKVVAQETQRIEVNKQQTFSLRIYRGIVEIYPTNNKEISIEHTIYDFDYYKKQDSFRTYTEEKWRSKLKIENSTDSINISNVLTRNLQYLKIYVPKEIDVNIEIVEYGEVQLHSIKNLISAQIYQGSISGDVYNTFSGSIVHEGTFHLKLKKWDTKRFIMLSGYDIDTNLNFTEGISASIIFSTDMGALKSDLGIEFSEKKGDSFNVKVNGKQSVQYKKIYESTIADGKDRIIIRNIDGRTTLSNQQ